MKIIIYNFNGDYTNVDKSNELTQIMDLDGTLREQCSVLNPSILVESTNLPTSANYMYIREFNRYYFITDIISVYNNRIRINGRVDVLYSYRDDILNQYMFIERNQNIYNEKIKDDLISFELQKKVEIMSSVGVFALNPFQTNYPHGRSDAQPHNVVITAINNYARTGSTIDLPTSNGLPRVNYLVTDSKVNSISYALTYDDAHDLLRQLLQNDTLKTYIKCVLILPFEPECTYDEPNVMIGSTAIACANRAKVIDRPTFDRVARFNISTNLITKFYECEPYSTYQIYIPYYGYYTINSELMGTGFQLIYYVNYSNGDASAILQSYSTQTTIATLKINLGVKVGLSSTNALEIQNQKISSAVSSAVGSLTSLLGLMSGNPVARIGGAIGLTKSITGTITDFSKMYEVGAVQLSTGGDGVLLKQEPFIRRIYAEPTQTYFNTNFGRQFGYPLKQVRALNTLSGFTIATANDFTIENATKTEVDEILQLFKEGVRL